MLDIFVVEAIAHVAAHHLTYRRVAVQARSNGTYGNVAVGDHADQAVTFVDQQRTAVDIGHQRGGLTNAALWLQGADVAGHKLADFHRRSPVAG